MITEGKAAIRRTKWFFPGLQPESRPEMSAFAKIYRYIELTVSIHVLSLEDQISRIKEREEKQKLSSTLTSTTGRVGAVGFRTPALSPC